MLRDHTHKEAFEKVSAAWKVASVALGIRLTIPYVLEPGVHCIGFLPDFGRPNGTVIGLAMRPPLEGNSKIAKIARGRDMFWTFLNPDVYGMYDDEEFKEALIDWGYFGPPDCRPKWLDL